MRELVLSMSYVSAAGAVMDEGGLLGHERAPHPERLLKIAIALKDGSPTTGWVGGLYSREAFELLRGRHR